MKLIVGLGNPGQKYAGNRHNIGFMAVDEIARGYGFAPWKKRFQGFTAEGQIGLEKCILLKPSTYMNESGRAVGEAMRFYKIPLADIIVIHDEIDLKPGAIRAKKGGGNAGHNGLKSISAHVGNEYVRVRLGIDHPGDKALVANYVLQDFAKADRTWLASLLEGVARGMAKLVEGSEAAFLSEAARGRSSSTPAAKLNGAVHATSSQLPPDKVHGALGTEAEALASIAAAASRTIEPMPASPVMPEAWVAASAPAGSGAAHAAPAGADGFAEPSDAGRLKHGIDQNEAEQAMQVLDPVDGALAAAAAHEVELFRAQASEPLFEPVAEDRAAAEAESIREPRSVFQSRPEEPSAGLQHERNPEVSSRAKSDGSFWTRWFRKHLRGGAR